METGERRIYNWNFKEQDVVLWDVFPVFYGENIKLTFETKNSDWLQGVWLMCDEGIEIAGSSAKSAVFWFETDQRQFVVKCFGRNGMLNVYNVWDRGLGTSSQSHSSGMLIYDIPNGRRYHCNDIGFISDFDKLVFTLHNNSK